MSAVLTDVVRSALHELSDVEYQSRVWTGRGGANEMSSFVECVSRLFDDSGLDLALERNQRIYGSGIDDDLRALGDLVAKVDSSRTPDQILRDPLMSQVRDLAAAILRELDEGGDKPANGGAGG